MNTAPPSSTRGRRITASRRNDVLMAAGWVLLLAAILRLGLVAVKWPELAVDRDAYLGIARTLLAGDGFCIPETNIPTAFRPPLYPVLLAIVYGAGQLAGIALLQVVAGLFAVAGAIALARHFGLGRWSWLAGIIVAVDPLQLQYTTQPMTEVVCTAICIWMIWAWARCLERPQPGRVLLAGLMFGLAILCRPSLLPFPLTLTVLSFLFGQQQSSWKNRGAVAARPLLLALLGFLCLLPWGVRNKFVFGHWKFTTTHGGYTLLLGNNPVFYEAVVESPWGTTWGDYAADHPLSQSGWYDDLQQRLDAAGHTGEFARDAAQYEMAYEVIAQQPAMFLQATSLRLARFWWPTPLAQASSIPVIVYWLVGLFYVVLYAAAAAGLVRTLRSRERRAGWLAVVALVITLTTVHLFYWSNARMRAPLIPLLAVSAVAVLPRSSEK